MFRKIHLNHKTWLCIIVLEIMILGGVLFVLRRQPSVALVFTQDDLVYDTGESGFYLDSTYDKKYVSTSDFLLPKGFYTIDIECEYHGPTRIEVVHPDWQVNSKVSDTIDPSVYSDISCVFQVRYSDRPIRVCAWLDGDAEDDYILVSSIRLASSPLTVRNALFHMIVLILVINFLLFGICHNGSIRICEEREFHFKVLTLLIAVISLPLMVNYLFGNAHDLSFHLARIDGIKHELLYGNFPVRMQSYWLQGHGYPSSIFYGDILLYIPAILRIFGVPMWAAYNFYVLLINVGTVFIAYYCFSKMSTPKTGLICTIVFSLNIYRLFDVYTRMAVGEYTAIMFMPLILYGMWCIYTLPEESKEHGRSWIPLSIGCTGIFLSHILSTEMVAVFIIFTALILWKKTFHRKIFGVLLKAALSTLLMCIWFLIPFLDYMVNGTYNINNPSAYIPYQLETRGVFPAQFFMNVYSVLQGTTSTTNGAAFDMPLTVGMASMLVLAGWFVFCCGKERDASEKKEEYLAVSLSVLSLAMTTYLFPYTWLSDRLPLLRMAAKSLQFPWRFFAVTGILLAWLLSIVLQKEWIDKKRRQVFAGVLVFIAFWQGISYMSGVLNEANVSSALQEELPSGIEGGEYLLVDWGIAYHVSDYTKDYIDQLTYKDVVSVSEWHRDRGAVVVSLTNSGDDSAQVEVPLINYKGYHAVTDGGDELEIMSGTSYRISVSVPAGFKGSFRVEFREPWYWKICEVISFTTVLFLFLYPIVRNHILAKDRKCL